MGNDRNTLSHHRQRWFHIDDSSRMYPDLKPLNTALVILQLTLFFKNKRTFIVLTQTVSSSKDSARYLQPFRQISKNFDRFGAVPSSYRNNIYIYIYSTVSVNYLNLLDFSLRLVIFSAKFCSTPRFSASRSPGWRMPLSPRWCPTSAPESTSWFPSGISPLPSRNRAVIYWKL